jgi:hypothetical protein
MPAAAGPLHSHCSWTPYLFRLPGLMWRKGPGSSLCTGPASPRQCMPWWCACEASKPPGSYSRTLVPGAA